AIGPDEWLGIPIPFICEKIRLPDHLIKDRDQVNRMTRRTFTVIISPGAGISDMRFMVRGIEVLAIPGRWEKDLSPKAIRAVCIGESIGLRGCWSIIVKARITHGLCSEVASEIPS